MEENEANVTTVRSVGLKYGLISALISIVFFLVLVLSGLNAFDNKWSWINVIVSIAILYLAHKNFKDEGDGFMTYGQGVGIGFWIALVAVVVGGLFTYVYSNFIDTGAMDAFYEQQYEKMQTNGMQDEQIDVAIEWTKKLFWPMYIFFGIFFGVLIAVLVSIFTQKKAPEQRF
jgi:TRAP-type C4-dicarboxylate transport system permease small subunit